MIEHTPPRSARLRRAALWGGALLLLVLPWVAMQFTTEVRWGLGDFVVVGAMLALACAAFELIPRIAAGAGSRWLLRGSIVAVFLLIWAELAVGVFS